jgi:ankyrin repeat protein
MKTILFVLTLAATFLLLTPPSYAKEILLAPTGEKHRSESSATSDLFKAVRHYNSEAVQSLLDKGMDINAKNKDGQTALMAAASKGLVGQGTETEELIKIVKLLLDKGADVNVKDIKNYTALMEAASSGNTEIVKLLLDKGADPKAGDLSHNTTLNKAIAGGYADIVKLLLNKDADIDIAGNKDGAYLMDAAYHGNATIINLFLDRGADINQPYKGGTVLMRAACNGQAATVWMLLDKGAKIDQKDSIGITALMCAAERGESDTVRALLRRGAKTDEIDNQGNTALMLAKRSVPQWQANSKNGYLLDKMHLEVIPLLDGSEKTDLSNAPFTPNEPPQYQPYQQIERARNGMAAQRAELGRLYYYGLKDVPQNLTEAYYWFSICDYELAGAAINGMGDFYKKAEELQQQAMLQGGMGDEKAMMALLVDPNVKKACHVYLTTLNKKLAEKDRFALAPRIKEWKKAHPLPVVPEKTAEEKKKLFLTERLAMEISSPDYLDRSYDLEGIKALIAAGADINMAKGLLSNTARRGHLDMVQTLVEGGADVNIADARGSTPLAAAARAGHADIVKYLLSKGANATAKDTQGNPVLCQAAESKNGAIITALVAGGADVNAVNHIGWTPLIIAAQRGNIETVRALLKAGADINFTTDRDTGWTALRAAQSSNHPEIAALLTSKNTHLEPEPPQPAPSPDNGKAKQELPKQAIDHPANALSDEAIKVLTTGTSKERSRMIAKIEANAGNYNPPALMAMAAALFEKFKDDDALFWYMTAHLRADMDLRICPRAERFQPFRLGILNMADYYQRSQPEKLTALAPKVLSWDQQTPMTYNIQWGTSSSACLPAAQQDAVKETMRRQFTAEYIRNRNAMTAPSAKNLSMDDLTPLAEAGDKAAQYKLGSCYMASFQCEIPVADSQRQYDHHAEQEKAQQGQMSMKLSGMDFKHEYLPKAAFWLQKSAAQKYLPAMHALAAEYMHAWHQIVPQDNKKACSLMLELAGAGDTTIYGMMVRAPWNPEAGKPIEAYAWEALMMKAQNPDKPNSPDVRELSAEDLVKAQARAQQYIDKYLTAHTPLCSLNDPKE